jgi:hypothetical protein
VPETIASLVNVSAGEPVNVTEAPAENVTYKRSVLVGAALAVPRTLDARVVLSGLTPEGADTLSFSLSVTAPFAGGTLPLTVNPEAVNVESATEFVSDVVTLPPGAPWYGRLLLPPPHAASIAVVTTRTQARRIVECIIVLIVSSPSR